ncbi:MAG TPA: shikimate dehydrogenase [Acidimicrobiales bacterium]|nr:shikimate dehydrogenase [Acidimicrobiales bacterium]
MIPGPTASTRVAAVIGHPVRHSLSPAIHNAAFAATGLDWTYLAFDVEPGDAAAAVAAMRALGLGGLSVTMPHKAAVLDHLDRVSPEAAALGAVNCIVPDGGELVGHNTDGGGFVDSLAADAGFDPSGARCLVLGAGGAARAVVVALARAGAVEVVVVNRSAAPAERAAALAGAVGRVGDPTDVRAADLVVNATPVGMHGGPNGSPVDTTWLGPHQLVADLVYHPSTTPLLLAADERGARTLGGVGMLVHQAARAFELWTGRPAPIAAMRAAVDRSVGADASRQNS